MSSGARRTAASGRSASKSRQQARPGAASTAPLPDAISRRRADDQVPRAGAPPAAGYSGKSDFGHAPPSPSKAKGGSAAGTLLAPPPQLREPDRSQRPRGTARSACGKPDRAQTLPMSTAARASPLPGLAQLTLFLSAETGASKTSEGGAGRTSRRRPASWPGVGAGSFLALKPRLALMKQTSPLVSSAPSTSPNTSSPGLGRRRPARERDAMPLPESDPAAPYIPNPAVPVRPFAKAKRGYGARAAPAVGAEALYAAGIEAPSPAPPLQRSRSGGDFAAQLPQLCPICFLDLKPGIAAHAGCNKHFCCFECLAGIVKAKVEDGVMPRCWSPDCRLELDPMQALKLLDIKDHKRYLDMALWANPRVEVCPECRYLLYGEGKPPTPGALAVCESCYHVFCITCKSPGHLGKSCDAAKREEPLQVPSRDIGFESAVRACPRCCVPIAKDDELSCDHMTCAQCRHEFCWTCLADRTVIFAHGNHHHRPSCRFYGAYYGADEYLPDQCVKCRLRGSACVAQLEGSKPARMYAQLVDYCSNLLRSALV